jgi:hypothetical protein
MIVELIRKSQDKNNTRHNFLVHRMTPDGDKRDGDNLALEPYVTYLITKSELISFTNSFFCDIESSLLQKKCAYPTSCS